MSSIAIIRVKCPSLTCGRILAVPADARGRKIRCGVCGNRLRVPLARIETETFESDAISGPLYRRPVHAAG